ncbi:hypothetical protein [Bacillus toyonensis]|uniref:hypothetical protein n=1 Tax=Bacillus toyonensis TaxID=155322 RepID=UPI001C0C6BF0|nr:hypothetical protein [Bacillus toyonensis]MBU4643129.1 hypothetical protein [Bacillus toyonensis]
MASIVMCEFCKEKEATKAFIFKPYGNKGDFCEECFNEMVSYAREEEHAMKHTICFACNKEIVIEESPMLFHDDYFIHCQI